MRHRWMNFYLLFIVNWTIFQHETYHDVDFLRMGPASSFVFNSFETKQSKFWINRMVKRFKPTFSGFRLLCCQTMIVYVCVVGAGDDICTNCSRLISSCVKQIDVDVSRYNLKEQQQQEKKFWEKNINFPNPEQKMFRSAFRGNWEAAIDGEFCVLIEISSDFCATFAYINLVVCTPYALGTLHLN